MATFLDLLRGNRKKNSQQVVQDTLIPQNNNKNTKKPLSQEQIQQIAMNNPGKVIDKYGNVKTEEQNQKEVKETELQEQRNIATKGGAVPGAKELMKRQEEAKLLNQELTQEPIVTEEDILKAVPDQSGLQAAGAVGGIIGGAKAGAVIGAPFAPATAGLSIPVGAAIGAISGAFGSISYGMRGDIRQAKKVGSIADSNIKQTISALNSGQISKEEALQRYRENKISLYAARENLKRQTDTDVEKFLGNGADELAQINDYIEDLETIHNTEFAMAYASPNPNAVNYLYANQQKEEE